MVWPVEVNFQMLNGFKKSKKSKKKINKSYKISIPNILMNSNNNHKNSIKKESSQKNNSKKK